MALSLSDLHRAIHWPKTCQLILQMSFWFGRTLFLDDGRFLNLDILSMVDTIKKINESTMHIAERFLYANAVEKALHTLNLYNHKIKA